MLLSTRSSLARQRHHLLWAAALLIGGLATAPAIKAEETYTLRIGTGQSVGLYRAAGNAICRLLDNQASDVAIDCSAEFSDGSFENIQALRSNQIDMAIVQSDVQFQAVSSDPDDLIRVNFDDLRHVASLMDEPLTLLATTRSGITRSEELAGRRVFLGESGSGTAFLISMLDAMGTDTAEFEHITELRTNLTADALCRNQIDAAAFVAGQPSILTRDATARCDVVIVPVTSERARALTESQAFYSEMAISADLYDGTPSDVPTIGVRATLVTRADVPDAVIGAVTQALYQGLPEFQRLHLAFTKFSKQTLAANCNTAPLHPATATYLAEASIQQGPC